MEERMENRKTETVWTVDRVKIKPMPETPQTRKRMEIAEPVEAILSRIQDSLPSVTNGNRQTKTALSRHCQAQQTMPAYLSKRINELQISSSSNLELLSRGLTKRATPSGVLLSVAGPRVWDSEKRRLVWREWSENDMTQLRWAADISRKALAERDDERVSRSISCLMALPSSGDNIGDDAAEMYLAVLSQFPPWAVERACVQWATESKWRPAPADLVGLCRDAVKLCERIVENERMALKKFSL